MRDAIRHLSRVVALAVLTAPPAGAQVVQPTIPAEARDAPFLVTAVLATAGSYGGLHLGIQAVSGAGGCGDTCYAALLAIPLFSATGSWLGAQATGGHPSFAAALGGSALGMGFAWAAASAFDDGHAVVLTYSAVQGLMTALSTLR